MENEIISYVKFAVKKNCNIKLNDEFYLEVFESYYNLCQFAEENNFGEIDEFCKMACLLLSVISNTVIEDESLSNIIACDAAIKMCEDIIEVEDNLREDSVYETEYRQKILDMLSNEELELSVGDLSNYFVVIYNDLKQNKTLQKRMKNFRIFDNKNI